MTRTICPKKVMVMPEKESVHRIRCVNGADSGHWSGQRSPCPRGWKALPTSTRRSAQAAQPAPSYYRYCTDPYVMNTKQQDMRTRLSCYLLIFLAALFARTKQSDARRIETQELASKTSKMTLVHSHCVQYTIWMRAIKSVKGDGKAQGGRTR